ncbi:MAG TPA: response regulator transcription factor, partial [Methylomirabilota bacterium]|nr:response regulator transcription factor [Methylomirabilota bacterium]
LLDIPAAKPDLLLVDLSLPRMNGADLIQLAQERWPDLPSLVLSGHGEAAYVTRARAAGARGYVLKGNPYELPDAIHSVLRGKEYLSVALR